MCGVTGLCDWKQEIWGKELLLSREQDDGRRCVPGHGGIPIKGRLGWKEGRLEERLRQVGEAVKLQP